MEEITYNYAAARNQGVTMKGGQCARHTLPGVSSQPQISNLQLAVNSYN